MYLLNSKILLAGITLSLFVTVMASNASKLTRIDQQFTVAQSDTSLHTQDRLSWLNEDWSGDDAPYAVIRSELDAMMARGQLTTSDIDKYEKAYRLQETDPLTTFRWVYAYWLADHAQPTIYVNDRASDYAFENARDPKTYNYTRLRFLETISDGKNNKYFILLGKRLLAKSPNDDRVQEKLVTDLHAWESPARKKEALHYAADLLKKHPKEAWAYSGVGYVYYVCWSQDVDDELDGIQAIKWYTAYLQRAKPNDTFYEGAREHIARIKKDAAYKKSHPNWRSELKK